MDCVIYDREGFSNRQRELLEKIKPLGRYFSKETIDYLNSLVNLDECILKDDAFFNEFGSMDLVYDLMKFNLIGRIYRTIDNDKRLTQDSIKSNNSIDLPNIIYTREDNNSFEILNCDFRKRIKFSNEKEIKPKVVLKEVEDKSDKLMDDLERQITINGEEQNDIIEEINELEAIKPSNGFFHKSDNGLLIVGKKKELEVKQEMYDRLIKQLEKVRKYGYLESEICNEITDSILDDYGLSDEDFKKTINRSVIKEYKYVDVVKRLR